MDTMTSYKRVPSSGTARKAEAKLLVPISDYSATKEERLLRNVYQAEQPDVAMPSTHAHMGSMAGLPMRGAHMYETPRTPGEVGGDISALGTKVYYELDPDDPRREQMLT